MKPRFFHILFVDSDNDKCVTNVEVRPSTHRRQEQPPSCVCGAPAPATQNSRIICVQHSCTHVTRKPCNPVPHLHRHASSSGPRMSSALTLLPLRREGCGVHLAPPSSPRRPTTPWPQVTILDFLETFTTSSRRWPHQFLFYLPFLLSDFRRAVCVMARTGVASRAAVRGVHFFASIVMSV